MSTESGQIRIAILDDYQRVALDMADWSAIARIATIDVFASHVFDSDEVIRLLSPYDVVCVMRERTPLTTAILEALPRLKLVVSTGSRNASIDVAAATALGVEIAHTGYNSTPTIELTWALILASARNIVAENASLRAGTWQRKVGFTLKGKTLGVLGLGRIGGAVAEIGRAFGMRAIAWSQNLTPERAADVGAQRVEKDELFREADVLSIHLVLSARTRGLVGAAEFALMKPSATIVNTSRGPIIDGAALEEALSNRKIAAAAIDVFDREPLPAHDLLCSLENVLATPHIGYVSRELYQIYFRDTVAHILSWLERHRYRQA